MDGGITIIKRPSARSPACWGLAFDLNTARFGRGERDPSRWACVRSRRGAIVSRLPSAAIWTSFTASTRSGRRVFNVMDWMTLPEAEAAE
jgi:hypothetical protein